MRRAIAYTRVSEVGDRGDDLESEDIQLGKIVKQGAIDGYRVVKHLHEEDVAGDDFTRPKFLEAVEDIENNRADIVVVYWLSRFARSPIAELYTNRIEAKGGELLSVSEPGMHGRTVDARFMRSLTWVIDARQKDISRQHRNDARERAIETDHIHLGLLPIGYMRQYVNERGERYYRTYDEEMALRADTARRRREAKAQGKRFKRDVQPKQAGPLVLDPATWKHMRRAFELTADECATRGEVSEYLLGHGIRLAASNVARTLANRTYLGEIHHGKYTAGSPGNPVHPPIVDEVLHRRAQWKGTKFRGDPQDPRLLNGLVRCSGCRSLMQSVLLRDQPGRRPTYRCHNRGKGSGRHRCSAPVGAVDAIALETHIDALMAARVDEWYLRIRDATGRDQLTAVKTEIAAAYDVIASWRQPTVTARTPVADWEAHLDNLEADRAVLIARHDSIVAALDAPEELLKMTGADYLALPMPDRRRWLRRALAMVFVRRGSAWYKQPSRRFADAVERTHVVWRAEGRNIEVPRRGIQGYTWRPFIWVDEDEPPAGVGIVEVA